MSAADAKKGAQRGPMFWMGMMMASYGVIISLVATRAIEGSAVIILMLSPMVLTVPMILAANRKLNEAEASCLAKGVAQKRYVKRIAVFTSLYLVSFGIMTFVTAAGETAIWLRALMAVFPGLAVAGMVWSIGRLIVEEQDEFLRMLVVRQSLVATGFALSCASMWGFLEVAEVVMHLDAYWCVIAWFLGFGIGAIVNRVQFKTWGAL